MDILDLGSTATRRSRATLIALLTAIALPGSVAPTLAGDGRSTRVLEERLASGGLLLRDPGGGPARVAPLQSMTVHLRIAGTNASTRFIQEFINPTGQTLHATYVFPRPDDAGIEQLRIALDGRHVDGTVTRCESPCADRARAGTTSMPHPTLDRHATEVLTVSTAGVRPGAPVQITAVYSQTVQVEAGEYRLRIPMAYATGGRAEVPASFPASSDLPVEESFNDLAPAPERLATSAPVRLTVDLRAGFALAGLESITHRTLETRLARGRWSISLEEDGVAADRDFVLRWWAAPRPGDDMTLHSRFGAAGASDTDRGRESALSSAANTANTAAVLDSRAAIPAGAPVPVTLAMLGVLTATTVLGAHLIR